MEKLILLIDNNEEEFYSLREALKANGLPYQCLWACSEERAVHLLHEFMPDLIILDYNMPRRNGIKCLKAIREIPQMNNVPVMFYSGKMNHAEHAESNSNDESSTPKQAAIVSMIQSLQKIIN